MIGTSGRGVVFSWGTTGEGGTDLTVLISEGFGGGLTGAGFLALGWNLLTEGFGGGTGLVFLDDDALGRGAGFVFLADREVRVGGAVFDLTECVVLVVLGDLVVALDDVGEAFVLLEGFGAGALLALREVREDFDGGDADVLLVDLVDLVEGVAFVILAIR